MRPVMLQLSDGIIRTSTNSDEDAHTSFVADGRRYHAVRCTRLIVLLTMLLLPVAFLISLIDIYWRVNASTTRSSTAGLIAPTD